MTVKDLLKNRFEVNVQLQYFTSYKYRKGFNTYYLCNHRDKEDISYYGEYSSVIILDSFNCVNPIKKYFLELN